MIHCAVNFLYSYNDISHLVWEAETCSPNKDIRWKDLKNIPAMNSLIIKQGVAMAKCTRCTWKSTRMRSLKKYKLGEHCSITL